MGPRRSASISRETRSSEWLTRRSVRPEASTSDRAMQMRVIRAALSLLEEAKEPGTIRELDIEWPQPFDEAKRDWQPEEPSPVVKMMIEQRRKAAEAARHGGGDAGTGNH